MQVVHIGHTNFVYVRKRGKCQENSDETEKRKKGEKMALPNRNRRITKKCDYEVYKCTYIFRRYSVQVTEALTDNL